MKPARLIILTVAVVAAGMAGYLALRIAGNQGAVSQQLAEPVVEREPTIGVLVAAANLPVGSRLNPESMRWADWPKGGVVDGFITNEARPDAMTEVGGAIVRMPIFAGEPIRPEKIADSSSRIMSSLLPAGKRAVATDITVSTGAGGFILPNDRVDVIMVRKAADDTFTTETVLNNVRVLAIDQTYQEADDGSKTVVGTTATLELTPDQAKVITIAQQMSDRLTLALRSIADAQEPDLGLAEHLIGGSSTSSGIQVIKSGNITKTQQTN